jgi:hypothetical protein
MRINKTIAQILVFSFIIGPQNLTFAAPNRKPAVVPKKVASNKIDPKVTEEMAKAYKEALPKFEQMCGDDLESFLKKHGTELEDPVQEVVVFDRGTLKGDLAGVECAKEAIKLALIREKLIKAKKELVNLIREMRQEATTDCPQCAAVAMQGQTGSEGALAKLAETAAHLDDADNGHEASCKKDQKAQEKFAQCASSFGCNTLQNIPSLAKAMKCENAGASPSCLRTFAQAAWDISLVKMLWDATKWGWDAAWKKLRKVEDKTSEAQHAASHMTPDLMAQFKKDPAGFMGQLMAGLYQMMVESITKYYGCEEWSGKPFAEGSKCLRSTDFSCLTCNQGLNLVCAGAGVFVGMIPDALVGGAVFKVMAKGGQAAVRGFELTGAQISKLNHALAGSKHAPLAAMGKAGLKTEDIARAGGQAVAKGATKVAEKTVAGLSAVARATIAAAQKAIVVIDKVVNSPVALKVAEYSLKYTPNLVKVGKKSADVTIKLVSGAGSVALRYGQLLDRMAHKGWSFDEALAAKFSGKTGKGAETAAVQASKPSTVDEIAKDKRIKILIAQDYFAAKGVKGSKLNIKGGKEAMEKIRQRLVASGYPFRALAQERGFEIDLPKNCNPNKLTLGF